MLGARGMCRLMRICLLVVTLAATAVLADEYTPVNALLRNGQLAEALQKAELYLEKNPRDPQMRFLKALIQQDSGRTGEAIATYTRLIDEYPELPEPYNNVAALYAAQGQLDKARDALEMAIRTRNSYAIAHENLGDIYARLAINSYGRALQLDAANAALAPKLALLRQLIAVPANAANAQKTGQASPPLPAASQTR